MGKKGFTLTELLIVLGGLFIIPAIVAGLGLWTDRNLDFWLTYLKGHSVHVPYLLALLLTIVLNGVALVLNIIGEIARVFVGA